jgi:hypothetical protein
MTILESIIKYLRSAASYNKHELAALPTVTATAKHAWTEFASLDTYGHNEGAKLAWRVEEELAGLQQRILDLIQVGWTKIKVITDHGWLLLPGGLPKAELPRHLTASRWNRCAIPSAGAQHGYPMTSWFWDAAEAVVLAPGVSCFVAGMEYAHIVSGGKATVAQMFVNNANGRKGLVCQYDVVCFDEISGISFDQKDGVNIMKGYMESGEFSRGKESIRGFGGMIMVGNFDVDVEHQQRIGHLFGPLPPEMRDDTAFMDRIHSYIPGWNVPKVSREQLTEYFGMVSDFLSSCWNHLRSQSRINKLQGCIQFGGDLSGRDTSAVQKTISGLLKLMFPDPEADIHDAAIEWAAKLALECRRRVKEQQKRIGAAEFRNTHFSFTMLPDGIEQFVSTPELYNENSIGSDPLPAGQVWALSPGGTDENTGLFRIDVSEGPGSGVKILNQSPHDRGY